MDGVKVDVAGLLEIARAAAEIAPGPWQNGIDDLEGVVAPYAPGLGNVICVPPLKCMYSSLEHWPVNATYIATFDPPTVIALLERVGELEGALRPFADAYDFWNGVYDGVHDDIEVDDQGKITIAHCRAARALLTPEVK